MPHQSYDGMGPKEDFPKVSWSASNVMATGDVSKTVSLQAVFKRPCTYTASFSLVPLKDLIVEGADLRAEATIEWSVDGNTVTRKVNVSNGVSVQGTGEGVRIVVRDVTVGGGGPLGIEYAVTVNVARGPRAGYNTPPILVPQVEFMTLAAGVGGNIPIPQNCGIKSLLVTVVRAVTDPTPILDQGVKVFQQNASGSTLCGYDPRAFQWVPIGPGVTDITVQNDTLGVVKFTIFFGVDG